MSRRKGTSRRQASRSPRSPRSKGGGGKNTGAGTKNRVVYGVGPVEELLRARRRLTQGLMVAGNRIDDPEFAELLSIASVQGISVTQVQREEFDELLGPHARHQGVCAKVAEYPYVDEEDYWPLAKDNAVIIALDSVTDPHNLGAISRSAHLLGAKGMLIPKDRSAEVDAVACKSSAGACEHLAISRVTNLARSLADLKEQGYWIVGAAGGEGAKSMWESSLTGPLCIVMGAEGKGLRPLVKKACDFLVEIPMFTEGVGSFNVSVAAGLLLCEARRQRG